MTRYKELLKWDTPRLQELRGARGLRDLAFATLHDDERDTHVEISEDGTRTWFIPRDYNLDHQGLVVRVASDRSSEAEESLTQLVARFGIKELKNGYPAKKTRKKKEEVSDDE